MKNIVILGSTGSIGVNALDVVERNGGRFNVVGLAAGSNLPLLLEQINKFSPSKVALYDSSLAKELREILSGKKIEVLSGIEGIIEVAAMEQGDLVLSAIVGAAGLLPTYSAIKSGKDVALANKESLVMAGAIMMAEAKRSGAKIIPVDSEHSAIFQALNGDVKKKNVKRLIITGSGGPFRGCSADRLNEVTVAEALRHPNWSMGKKISIDSATMMNKGFEMIEARWLFDLEPGKIDILIHPQSIVHSMVEFVDTSIIAQLGIPDMRLPISYALNYPDRIDVSLPSLNLEEITPLTFEKPDTDIFPSIKFAYQAISKGDTYPAVLNAANEVAVQAFISGEIRFPDIPVVIEET
ncbi:MAG: 1-deoxy-D-xylulose-5-phosphate reductoisomerase, partial [Nitrospinota bacterium]